MSTALFFSLRAPGAPSTASSPSPPSRWPLPRRYSAALVNQEPLVPERGLLSHPVAGRFWDVTTALTPSTPPNSLRLQRKPVGDSPVRVHSALLTPLPQAWPGTRWAILHPAVGTVTRARTSLGWLPGLLLVHSPSSVAAGDGHPGAAGQAPEGREPWTGPRPTQPVCSLVSASFLRWPSGCWELSPRGHWLPPCPGHTLPGRLASLRW